MIHGSPQGRDLAQGLFMDGDRVLRQTGQQEVWEEAHVPLNRQWEASASHFHRHQVPIFKALAGSRAQRNGANVCAGLLLKNTPFLWECL